MVHKRGIGQKIVFVIALGSYLMALACASISAYLYIDAAPNDPIVAAFAASVVFFVGTGIVLHMMARTDLPDLRIK